jgi:pSer/pThr/pTyr-binding forkhead associated (FHA) protein
MDPTSVGNLGTLVFLSTRQPEKVVTAYPVDEPIVTIGRDADCDIRLYYPEVSPVHCKLIFEDRKVSILSFQIIISVIIIVEL